jgi:excisionase family DNA binding protein
VSAESIDRSSAVEVCQLPPVLTVEQAARLLRIGRSKAYDAVRTGDWPTRIVRVGRCIRTPTAEVLRLLGLPSEDVDKEAQQ